MSTLVVVYKYNGPVQYAARSKNLTRIFKKYKRGPFKQL